MPNQFTEVTHKGFGSRILNSVIGVLIGILLFFGSFILLYWNEGQTDISKIAQTSTEIQSEKIDQTLEGTFVSLTGKLSTTETLGDEYLKSGNYIALKRIVEMYAWNEDQVTKSEKNIGGSETQTTTYTYHKEWTEKPEESSQFKHPEEHENLSKKIQNAEYYAKNAQIGAYNFTPSMVVLPEYIDLRLSEENIILNAEFKTTDSSYIYSGSANNPQIGDIRISYKFVPVSEVSTSLLANNANFSNSATIFGKIKNNTIEPFVDEDGNRIYRIFYGSRDESIAAMKSEHNTLIWILRAVGFAMMWGGMMLVLGPISTLLDILPILGSISGFFIALATFLIALILSVITILVSMIFHNIIALIFALLIAIFFIVRYIRQKTAKNKIINS